MYLFSGDSGDIKMLQKSKWNMDLPTRGGRAGTEQLGRKPSIQPGSRARRVPGGVAKCLRESRDQEKQQELKKKITSCQTNWVTFVEELVTEQRWEHIFRGNRKRFGNHGDAAGGGKGRLDLLAGLGS